MKKALLICLLLLAGCNKEGREEVIPLPTVAGEYEHLFFFLEDLRLTSDSLFVNLTADAAYEQLNDTIMIVNNGISERTIYYQIFSNGELYFSYGHPFNDNPLKLGSDSLIYEMYRRK